MENPGETFLHNKNSSLHTDPPIEHEFKRQLSADKNVSREPADKIAAWMKVLERTHMGHRDDPEVITRIKKYYHKKYVIKPENIPESYYENRQQAARELGQGPLEFTPEMRKQAEAVIINDQKSSLNTWLEYLTSQENDSIRMWAKYWAFNGMVKLSAFDKDKCKFSKRTNNTYAPFPELNREALARVLDAIVKKANKEQIPTNEGNVKFIKLLEDGNFGNLYAEALKQSIRIKEIDPDKTQGEWIKYNQGSDHTPLVNSLQGFATGWCTAASATAENQLRKGDFYVYYTYDQLGKPVVPRLAIRMEGGEIAEVRGVADDQNIESHMIVPQGEDKPSVLDAKLAEFGEKGEKYKKRSKDMRLLTEIEQKYKNNEKLTIEDLKFLYQIDSIIEGFGYSKDPRIDEIIKNRNNISDLSEITGFKEHEISTTQDGALAGGIKYHYGNLFLDGLTSTEGLTLPGSIGGSLSLKGLKSTEGLTLPDSIGGDLFLEGLKSTEGLTLPDSIGGDLFLEGLKSTEGLTLPRSIGGNLFLDGLTSTKGVTFPDSIGGDLYLRGLTSTEGLTLPDSIGGSLFLSGLTSTEGLTLPGSIGGSLFLDGLTSTEGLTLPGSIGGSLFLDGLTSAKGLTLPGSIGRSLSLNGLKSTEGLTLPDSIGGSLFLDGLTSTEGLTLPDSIGGSLFLDGLTSTEGLTLPGSIGGDLYLRGLTSTEGLTLPGFIRGSLFLDGLTSAKGVTFPGSIGGSLFLSGLTSTEGLTLPGSIGGSLSLKGLKSTEGLTLPGSIGRDLFLDGLTSAEGVTFPDSIGRDLSLKGLKFAEGLTLPYSIGRNLFLSGLTSAEGLTLPGSIGGNLFLSGLTSAEGLTLPGSIGGNLFLSGLTSAEKNSLLKKHPKLEGKIY